MNENEIRLEVLKFHKNIDLISNDELKRFVKKVFVNIFDDFKEQIGSVAFHHNYKGGLIEHTNEVALFCSSNMYEFNDDIKDYIIAGCLLHDVGKTYVYNDQLSENKRYKFYENQNGKILGHIYLGLKLINKVNQEAGLLKENELMTLEHIILSHHGSLKYGSPVRPNIVEAKLIHEGDLWSAYRKKSIDIRNEKFSSEIIAKEKNIENYEQFANDNNYSVREKKNASKTRQNRTQDNSQKKKLNEKGKKEIPSFY